MGWFLHQLLAPPLQGWKSSVGGGQSRGNREAGAGVFGDDSSSGVTAEADSPRGKPLWSRDAVLGASCSCDLLET